LNKTDISRDAWRKKTLDLSCLTIKLLVQEIFGEDHKIIVHPAFV